MKGLLYSRVEGNDRITVRRYRINGNLEVIRRDHEMTEIVPQFDTFPESTRNNRQPNEKRVSDYLIMVDGKPITNEEEIKKTIKGYLGIEFGSLPRCTSSFVRGGIITDSYKVK